MNREGMQKRTFNSEFKARAEGETPIIEGRFISFESEYQVCPGGVERISPDLEIEGEDVRALINHDTTLVLGRTTANTLKLERKDDGEWGTISINPKDSDAMNCHARVERGDVSQCSFGFDILDEETEFLEDGTVRWTIKKIRLYEVSVCTFPAYEDTSVSARADELAEIRKRSLDAWKADTLKKLKG